jgi:hypothetical protein
MIKGEHLHKEITEVTNIANEVKTDDKFKYAVLKVGTLALKLLLNIRQNQVVIMTAQGVETIKPKTVKSEKE